MNILISCDKFKGSLSAKDACEAIKDGLNRKSRNIKCIIHPMADGGDGSLEILKDVIRGQKVFVEVVDPLGRPIMAYYVLNNNMAYIELALASGIALLDEADKNPMKTNTYGTCLLIKDAIDKGANDILLFAGGSATNDAGLGIAYTLGYSFYDDCDKVMVPKGANLVSIKRINKPDDLPSIHFTILTDVTNPMFGKNGAAQIYARQKGANRDEIILLDKGLQNTSKVIQEYNGCNIANMKAGGCAGGLAAGLYGLFAADIKNGFEYISQMTQLEQHIKTADLVITGEGKLDSQSLDGKVVGSLASLCKKYSKLLIVFCGMNELNNEEIDRSSIKKIHTVMTLADNLHDAQKRTKSYLSQLAFQVKLEQL